MGTIIDKKAWAEELLKSLGNSNPSANTIKFVQAWAIHESGAGAVVTCDHNPLNTTQRGAGVDSVNCNSVGVQSFTNPSTGYTDGLHATDAVLHNGLYPSLLHALSTNDENGLGFNGHSMAANIQSDLSVWATGQRTPINASYANAILQIAGEKNIPSGGDLGNVTEANPTINPGAALDQINSVFGQLSGLFSNPTRIAKGVLGGVLILVGVILGIKQLTGFDPVKIATKAAKGLI